MQRREISPDAPGFTLAVGAATTRKTCGGVMAAEVIDSGWLPVFCTWIF